MKSDKQVPTTGYCPTQNKEFTVYGNYINDGFGGYTLGTITCPYKKLAKVCKQNPCPLRFNLPKNI